MQALGLIPSQQLFPQLNVMLSDKVTPNNIMPDPHVIPHIASMFANLGKTKTPEDIIHLSNLVKQVQPKQHFNSKRKEQVEVSIYLGKGQIQNKDYTVRKFSLESQKLQWAGYSVPKEEIALIDNQLYELAEKNKVKEIRFWGKILGTLLDYYVVQGVTHDIKALEDIPKGAEKRGEGVNYYTYWVTNNLIHPQWIELPLITPQHIKVARKIKQYFTGYLQKPVLSSPPFDGLEKHYLKAQLVRITSSLEIVPKGVFKPNDDNPKIVEYEQEPKIPEFAELATLQNWVHRNQNVLNLGRCTHYIDPATPQDQIEAITAQLAEKDPQVQRLRAITEDKLPQGSPLGVQNVWQIRTVGDTQVFQKDQGSSVYGVIALKNIYWPGWVTIGYKSGYSNHYVGYGLKWVQPSWNQYENANLGEQAQDVIEYGEPNPKQEPKPVVVQAAVEEVPEE